MDLDKGSWRGRKVLLTGHTGFKGAWLALWLEQLGAEVIGLALAPPPGGAWSAMAPWPAIESHEVDLRDRSSVADLVAEVLPDVVLHLAAQAIVREGFDDPVGTYSTNVTGTVNLLDALRSAASSAAVVVVTSDKVYDDTCGDRPFTERDRLGGADPYSSSKACAELVVAAWRRSFATETGIRLATARAGNVLGGGDRGRDRLGPDVQRALTLGTPLRLRHPNAIRPWQFVLDPLRGYLLLAQHLLSGDRFTPNAVNFGPTATGTTVRALAERVFAMCGSGRWELDPSAGGPEAPSLQLDASLARDTLGWTAVIELEEALRLTAEWWRAEAAGRDLRALALSQIRTCEEALGT